jgi:hypothetical protein
VHRPAICCVHPSTARALGRIASNSDVFRDMGSARAAARILRAAVSVVPIAGLRGIFDPHQDLAPLARMGASPGRAHDATRKLLNSLVPARRRILGAEFCDLTACAGGSAIE